MGAGDCAAARKQDRFRLRLRPDHQQGAGTNQILGAAVMGVGMALFEDTVYEHRGQPINNNFADYLVPTCADLPELDVTFLDYPD